MANEPYVFGGNIFKIFYCVCANILKVEKNSKLATLLIPCKLETGCCAVAVKSSGMSSSSCDFMATE